MSAVGRNFMKLVTGIAVGAGIGALTSKLSRRASEPEAAEAAPRQSLGETVAGWQQRLRGRWEDAKTAGDVAQQATEAELRARFRVASIFWPPFAIIYWPMGFGQRCYDLTAEQPQTCTHQDLIDLRRDHRLSR